MTIGEAVLGAVLGVVLDKLASQEIIDLLRRSKVDQSLVNDLKIRMLATQKLLCDAEEKQLSNRAVEQWLDELKHWCYRAEEVMDEVSTEALRCSLEAQEESSWSNSKVCSPCLLPPCFSKSSRFAKTITPQIKEVVSMLENMLKQGNALGLRELSATATSTYRVPTTSLLEDPQVFGRDQEREQLIKFLLFSNESERKRIGVVAIVGMGGLGKTTLAKMVYNDERIEKAFDCKVWVCVSDHFDILQLTKSILESVSGEPCSGSPDLNFLQNQLSTKLKEKKLLLVMDDVWNENYEHWERLRTPLSAAAIGSKFIVTTRNTEVASIMQTTEMIRLRSLSDDNGWSLFSRHAFELASSIPNPHQQLIGRKIVHKCQGLPLAIKTLGALLPSKQDSTEWEAILNSSIWTLPSEKSNVIPALRLSYHHLPAHLKRCFAYCAIFPKDEKINCKQLVRLWLAEGLLNDDNERTKEDVGNEYLRHLLSRSFLEPMDNENYVTMHDLMHDLAQGVSGEFVVTASKIFKRSRHFSYFTDEYDRMSKFGAIYESKYLRTFLPILSPWGKVYWSHKALTELMSQLQCLRVLSLSGCKNLMLPESITSLRQLRYLDVSHTNIKQLPESVSTLYNLQTLLLLGCGQLEKLPKDMWRLQSLRHLDMRETDSMHQMPKQMGKLKCLQTLTDFVVGNDNGSGIKELGELSQIRDILTLRRLQNVTNPNDAIYANLTSKEYIHGLALKFDSEDTDNAERGRMVLQNLKPHKHVKRLSITNYPGRSFPTWLLIAGCQVYLENITFLCLSGCRYCQSLPPLGQLPCLEKLIIEGMDHIIRVGAEFYGAHSELRNNPFPVLKSLSFQYMKGWEVWSKLDDGGGAVCFPCLQMLSLVCCPKLKGNLPVHMPSLEELEIDECWELGRCLPSVPSIHGLPLVVAECSYAESARAFDLNSITKLSLSGLVQLVKLPSQLLSLSSLSRLSLSNLVHLEKLPAQLDRLSSLSSLSLSNLVHLEKLPAQLDRLSSLIKLDIYECENLSSLANVRLPLKLEFLEIRNCRFLESLPVGLMMLTHLQHIILDNCSRLSWNPEDSLPTSLTYLGAHYCKRWEFPITMEKMHHYTSLESLSLGDMGNQFVSFPLGIFPNLRFLNFSGCQHLEAVYVPQGILSLSALDGVWIWRCPKLEIIGKGEAEAAVLPAPNLTELVIEDCEKLKPVALATEEVVCLPRLEWLEIDRWDHQITSNSLPRLSSLKNLTVKGCYIGESFPPEDKAGASLPTSLNFLSIENFPKLRKLDGNALKSLTSLEELYLGNCPHLKCLPEEGLPPSLGHLNIWSCPSLVERCKPQKGRDWSKICDIPRVDINFKCIMGSI